ncbi:rust resistance kinase Lr10-like isoform X1 [Diospyros lotus]|uniref:rust resistance kinase Lr10-like isoform X1 n=2 Tax=Diospyros lotus TaxID=55363 RepID=UPI002251F846|nr:rust resistance kinase Lr10-like isoform X1 [Diospyros lotus]XP_052181661.1 rust resistance kinase Lr10-like isoform X1 [Diospyros lotus]XP_052181662.1 rust resistance kinase Lr10-like isoform X1 [Diospyros lotus]
MSPPPYSNDGPHVATITVPVLVLAGISVISCFCTKIARRISELRTAVAQPAPSYVVQATSHVVHVWEVDAPTMERILEDLAKEKPIRFTAQELCTFTSNYSTRLGSGGFGIVYKGQFPNGVKIAVKVLNRNSDGRAEEQSMAEVTTIGRTYHRNLVRLYGFCFDQFMSALVYEYMENGSLDKYLFSDMQAIEEWEKLREIAIGTAKGIAYLHEECHQRIIHYDIKPGNVLLDEKFTPKVADFGLAKLCNRDSTHVSLSGYRGTPGYSAPEFQLRNFPITHKCDVHSFGMLLFEIIGRRRNARIRSTDSLDWFPKQVWEEYEKGELAAMLSGCWNEEKDREQVEKAAMVALWCVQDSPEDRPPMSAVVKMLEGGVEVMPPPKPFQYLLSISVTSPDAPSNGSDSSDISTSTSCGTNSRWYKDTTPIMAKYEIQMASITTTT